MAMTKPFIVDEAVRELFGRPRLVDVRVRGQWPVFEKASLVAVDLTTRTVVFQRVEYHDRLTHPTGAYYTQTIKSFRMDDITWSDS